MKKVMKLMTMVILMVATSLTASAQAKDSTAKQRMSREQLAEVQARHIAEQLALDDAKTKKFVETYGNYQKELWSMGPRRGEGRPRPGNKGERGMKPKDKQDGQAKAQPKERPQKKEMTDAETEKAIKERFEQSQKMLNLREKYYAEYSKFLTPKQIQRVYTLEKQMMQRLSQHKGKRPNAPQPRS